MMTKLEISPIETSNRNTKLPKMFRPAILASLQAQHWQHKIGCALYRKRKLISVGWNIIDKTHPLCLTYENYHVTIHAELMAIIKAKNKIEDFDDCFVVVFRQHKNGKPALAKPCEGCKNILKSFGINYGYWTTEEGWEEGEL